MPLDKYQLDGGANDTISTLLRTPAVIPLISLEDFRSEVQWYLPLRGILIPFYEIWGQSAIFYRRRGGIHKILSYDGPVGLSSIGPDDYVMSEAYFVDFLRFAQECGFDFVVAWDAPTYVDMPTDDSWRNTVHGIEQLRRIMKAGIPAIGLLNGSNADQYDRCAGLMVKMGVEDAAVHVSDYLRYRRDRLLMDLMWDALKIATSKFHRTLIIGATDPYLIRYPLREACPESSVSGLSWFIDAKRGLVYSAGGKANAFERDILCACPSCSKGLGAGLTRSTLERAIHNLSVVQGAMEGRGFPQVESVDVVHRNKKLAIVSDLHIGTEGSLVSDFCDAMREEKPGALIFLGDTFDIAASDFKLLEGQSEAFFNLMHELSCQVYPIYGGADKSLPTLAEQIRRIAYDYEIHPNQDFARYLLWEFEYRPLYQIFKFYVAAREEGITILTAKGRRLYAAYGPSLNFGMPSPERVGEILKEKGCGRLVLGGYHRMAIGGRRFYSLGAWQVPEEEDSESRHDLRGALFLDKKGLNYREFGR